MFKDKFTRADIYLDSGQMCRIQGAGILNIEQTIINKNGRDVPYVYAVLTVVPEEIGYGPAQTATAAHADDLPSLQGEQAQTVREPTAIPGWLGGGSL